MDFVAILTDMFPQVHRAVIGQFIDDVGNQTPEEFELISDMILTYIKENIDINDAFTMLNASSDSNNSNNEIVFEVEVKPKPPIRINRLARNPTTVRPARVEINRHTGAIPKRIVRSQSHSSTVTNNMNGTESNNYSKMTLVRNSVPQFMDDNDNMEIIDFIAIENENKIFEHFVNMLPQADPTYLKEKARFYQSNPAENAEEFILERIELKDYPSIDEYFGKLDEINSKKAYTSNFNLQRFVKEFPNAPEHFAKLENPYSTDEGIKQEEMQFVLAKLLNKYRRQRASDVEKLYKRNKYNIIKTCDQLDVSKEQNFADRPLVPEKFNCTNNMLLLQTLAYAQHRSKIDGQIYAEAQRLEFARAEASATNSFLICGCCYRDDLLPEDCVTCIEGCLFCRECVRTGAEHCLAEAKTQYKCLSDCESTFTDGTLQLVLIPVTYQRLTQRRQMEEVAQADIVGLETCPFCEYATIPAEEDKIFQCQNIDCKKVSCRKCRHESHLPLRCNEIEYDEDVRMRTTIEDKMSEAMLRFKCARCQKPIIKEDGCNKITCPCGQFSCYVCKKAISSYGHFDQGRCQLWQNAEVSRAEILRQADKAKADLGININPELLKFDPTKNF